MKLEERVKRVIEEQLHIKVRSSSEELFDMGADSLDLLELSIKLEEEFSITFGDDVDISSDMTVRDVIRIVKNTINKQGE